MCAGTRPSLLDYHPFGTIRLNNQSGTFNEKRKFAGQEYDDESELSYMQARYYHPATGRFLSEDSVFLDLENSQTFSSRYKRLLEQHLSNPQNLNSYSYSLNNPVTFRDPQGEVVPIVLLYGLVTAVNVGLMTIISNPALLSSFSDDLSFISNPQSSGLQKNLAGISLLSSITPVGKTIDSATDATKDITRTFTVYQSVENGVVKYIGQTVNFVRRQSEHLRNGRIVNLIDGLTDLPNKSVAKAVEQVLIEANGLSKNGGTLLNKINSIAPTNSTYIPLTNTGKSILNKLWSKK